jgi:calcitonin receptor-like
MGCNYFWMLCEGVYLHTLIVVAVFAEKQHLMWYYFLGWGRCHCHYLLIYLIKTAF